MGQARQAAGGDIREAAGSEDLEVILLAKHTNEHGEYIIDKRGVRCATIDTCAVLWRE